MQSYWLQVLYAVVYYFSLLALVRAGGKRLAGQITTFDLIILITLGVVLQTVALQEGKAHAIIYVLTVFVTHQLTAKACARSDTVRRLLRGGPRVLIRDGQVLWRVLQDEGLSHDDMLAGLRKLGFDSAEKVKKAVLEETGHISAVAANNSTG